MNNTPPLPPQVAAILTMIFGALLTLFTALHWPTDALPAIQAAVQLIAGAVIIVAGLVAHLRVHEKHQEAQTVQRAAAVLTNTPLPTSPAAWVGSSLNAAPPSYTRSSAALSVTSDTPMAPDNAPASQPAVTSFVNATATTLGPTYPPDITTVKAPVPPAPVDATPAPAPSDTTDTPS